MAHTAHTDEEMMKEHYDDKVVLDKKIDQLVEWIKQSKRFLIFTGAGISTSAGIPDFRGPNGVWTLKAQGKARTGPTTPTTKAVPTACHMAIVTLQNKGILSYLISQNCDGLHRRSGMRADKMSELHGNGNVEECEDCGLRYFRDWSTYRISRTSDHFTGNFCSQPGCRGRLLEWTIDFGQNLPEDQLSRAMHHSANGDLHLVLGSSLTVSPACTMPKRTKKNGGRLVICNLQKTPLYDYADINIHAPCDYVMSEVLSRLGLVPEVWELKRKIVVGVRYRLNADNVPDAFQLVVNGVDPSNDNVPATLFKKIEIQTPDIPLSDLTGDWIPIGKGLQKKPVVGVRLHFMRHYAEPHYDLKHPLTLDGKQANDVYILTYAPTANKEWNCVHPTDVAIPPVTKIGALPHLTHQQIPIKSDWLPKQRMWSAGCLATYPDGKKLMINFGGARMEAGSHPTIELLDLNNGQWAQVPVPSNTRGWPYIEKERWGHSATLIEKTGLVYLIGGWDGSCQYNDVYVYDTNNHTLKPLQTTGASPDCRAGHSAVAFGSKIVVYGGAICKGGPYHYYKDVFILDTEKATWTELKCGNLGQGPTATAQHTAVGVWGRFMLVIGGYDGEWIRNDVYCLDLKLKLWNRVDMSGDLPPVEHLPQTNFRVPSVRSCSFLLKDDVVLVFGKAGAHFLDIKEWRWKKVPGKFPDTSAQVGIQNTNGDVLMFGGSQADGEARENLDQFLITYKDN